MKNKLVDKKEKVVKAINKILFYVVSIVTLIAIILFYVKAGQVYAFLSVAIIIVFILLTDIVEKKYIKNK